MLTFGSITFLKFLEHVSDWLFLKKGANNIMSLRINVPRIKDSATMTADNRLDLLSAGSLIMLTEIC